MGCTQTITTEYFLKFFKVAIKFRTYKLKPPDANNEDARLFNMTPIELHDERLISQRLIGRCRPTTTLGRILLVIGKKFCPKD